MSWYKKALIADPNNAGAMLNIGICYDNGQGVERNFNEAMSWYMKAADLGNEDAKEKINELKK